MWGGTIHSVGKDWGIEVTMICTETFGTLRATDWKLVPVPIPSVMLKDDEVLESWLDPLEWQVTFVNEIINL